ncbi:recombinase family protein [Sphaerisporangium sp. NPDC049002]|uniref:recombinase family protein n=1 Tax=Sphaerisporangium sp. NPDC049002 TaxID=3155392 RepID=UPI0033C5B7D3
MKAAIYVRVSSDHQVEGTSLDEQVLKCQEEAQRRGWTATRVYREEGVSGTKESRPQLDALLGACRRGEFQAVFVSKLDRLARDEVVRILTMRELTTLNVQLVALDLGGADHRTDEGELIHGIVGQVAAWERKRLVRRMAEGSYATARQGRWPSSKASLPYGFTLAGQGKVAHVEPEADMLRLVTGWIVDGGLTRGRATARLNEQGYRQRNGKPWHQDNLRDMLRCPALKGELTWGGDSASGKYGEAVIIPVEPIIPPGRWGALQVALRQNTRVSGQRKEYPLGQGRLVSPCGLVYGGVSRESETTRVYRCRGRRWTATGAPKCSCPNLNADALDQRIWREVVALLGSPDRLEAMANDYLGNRAAQIESERGELERVTAQITRLETSVTTTIVDYARQGLPADAVKAATEQIGQDLERLRKRQAELTAQGASGPPEIGRLSAMAGQAGLRLKSMPLAQQVEVLQTLDLRVSVLDMTRSPRLRLVGSVPIPGATTLGATQGAP